jgi:hypothetical protein
MLDHTCHCTEVVRSQLTTVLAVVISCRESTHCEIDCLWPGLCCCGTACTLGVGAGVGVGAPTSWMSD